MGGSKVSTSGGRSSYTAHDACCSCLGCTATAALFVESQTGNAIYAGERARFVVGGTSPDGCVRTVHRNVNAETVPQYVAELKSSGWTRVYAAYEAF